ncbi:MFS monocarboxylic acid transporter [Pleurostoma richardsiae]|uniref:Probable transporter MCH1 n=1 Tax=Pleurostoma richardsiae TaxID=41990 RepID=A0AA38RXC3_9PEZI|nr:MFS monocarboxylic acid transporter [Pleurostoma richardsiae]
MAGGAEPESSSATPLLRSSPSTSTLGPASSTSSGSSPTPSRRQAARAARAVAFIASVVLALCSNSVATFSLYGPVFQSRLRYTQYQVNGVAIAASFALYLPVPFLGYVCDRVGPTPLSLLSAIFFGTGYSLAAGLYRHAATSLEHAAGSGGSGPGDAAYALMVLAFISIGVGTSGMYLGTVATCAKNFGKGRYRGLALAAPITACGLSGLWLSQVASRILYERLPDGGKGDVDPFRFFVFLAVLLTVAGLLGTFTLRVVDEKDLIDEAVEELERSGILGSSALLSPGGRTTQGSGGYGSIEEITSDPLDEEGLAGVGDAAGKDTDDEEARLKKDWVLNAETRRYLSDPTMWLFALGFFFMIGPGETFLNNLGSVIKTLYPPASDTVSAGSPTSAATHVSIVCVTSTVARILVGALTDLLAPSPRTQHVQVPAPPRSSSHLLQRMRRQFSVSRVVFMIFFGLLSSAGMVTLASGAIQNHGERFWVVSGLVGAGYGATFSLTPIIVTVIWGVENFATNWGIIAMFPALGAALWGFVYSAVYQAGAEKSPAGGGGEPGEDILCYGTRCYAPAFWAMSASVWLACVLLVLAWKGKNGWTKRGIVI